MTTEIVSSIVSSGVESLGIALPPRALSAFESYFRYLEERRQYFNLTAISGAEETARFHFLDSLVLLKAAQFNNMRVIDIGSGAGLPGVPLKIAEPSIDLTLLDSTSKRVTFLTELSTVLGIGAACLHARAEVAAFDPGLRDGFDIAVSRAVARLNTLCELCLPYVRVGGSFIAMKGADSDSEIHEAGGAISALGAELQGLFDYKIPYTDSARRLVLIRKLSATPEKYPRRFARIQKAPIQLASLGESDGSVDSR